MFSKTWEYVFHVFPFRFWAVITSHFALCGALNTVERHRFQEGWQDPFLSVAEIRFLISHWIEHMMTCEHSTHKISVQIHQCSSLWKVLNFHYATEPPARFVKAVCWVLLQACLICRSSVSSKNCISYFLTYAHCYIHLLINVFIVGCTGSLCCCASAYL